MSGQSVGARITSYNVCYTKLLRVLSVNVYNDTAYVNLSEDFKNACQGISSKAEMLLVYAIVNTVTAMDGINRITSYNVCYTKLLRVLSASSRLNLPFWEITPDIWSSAIQSIIPEPQMPLGLVCPMVMIIGS